MTRSRRQAVPPVTMSRMDGRPISPDLRCALLDLQRVIGAMAVKSGDSPDDALELLVLVLNASGRLEEAAMVKTWTGG